MFFSLVWVKWDLNSSNLKERFKVYDVNEYFSSPGKMRYAKWKYKITTFTLPWNLNFTKCLQILYFYESCNTILLHSRRCTSLSQRMALALATRFWDYWYEYDGDSQIIYYHHKTDWFTFTTNISHIVFIFLFKRCKSAMNGNKYLNAY